MRRELAIKKLDRPRKERLIAEHAGCSDHDAT
jgi:predicted GIY-YIG superfamily endonuclease